MDTVLAEQCELDALIREPYEPRQPAIGWLGQAGFLIRWRTFQLAIDPYLSDSLAAKYRGSALPHVRLMPPPIAPERLMGLHVVLCTHAHTDHMDPETLSRLAAASPNCRFVVPRAEEQTAIARGVPVERMTAMNAGEHLQLAADLSLRALPAAHEELETDRQGNHCCLGYVLNMGPAAIYHSGDCAPFRGLDDDLAGCKVDLALLPVNGRDVARRSRGILGNFTFDEATALCIQCRIPAMIACHFGMFDFNTVAESWLDEQIARVPRSLQCVRPRPGYIYRLAPRARKPGHLTGGPPHESTTCSTVPGPGPG
jgi:L-ascorbate metabolism protein UlaG (beta-lactamase superfamily)